MSESHRMTQALLSMMPGAALLLGSILLPSPLLGAQQDDPTAQLQQLGERMSEISVGTRSEQEYSDAVEAYRSVLEELQEIDYEALGRQDQVDYRLIEGEAGKQIYEYDTVELYTTHPTSYFQLGQTNQLFVRECGVADAGVRDAVEELNQLPAILENARDNLERPARAWTGNAIYQAYYARKLLTEYVPQACVDDEDLKQKLLRAADRALEAVDTYEAWLENELLPRSDRSAAWDPEHIEFYMNEYLMLDYSVEEMLEVAYREERETRRQMEALADSIHPSGDLHEVWEHMKDEAPPWEGVLPMARSFVDMTSEWLRNEGDHVVSIPGYIDYGARITPPMSRRSLSFGGATRGPDLAGRQSGYYILTPLEERLSEEERASRIRSYNPYWTHVISYHEWLGHNVQIAAAREHVERPIRIGYDGGYFSQAWSFYLERLLEQEGYFQDRLDYITALKTRMGRLQMRMWRVQRIITKLEMARGEMSFDEAVDRYIERIGMEPANAFIEVQRDSQTPFPPGREIIGELEIEKLRAEYRRRMGEHYSLKAFHDQLLTYGDLPFPMIRRLMFLD